MPLKTVLEETLRIVVDITQVVYIGLHVYLTFYFLYDLVSATPVFNISATAAMLKVQVSDLVWMIVLNVIFGLFGIGIGAMTYRGARLENIKHILICSFLGLQNCIFSTIVYLIAPLSSPRHCFIALWVISFVGWSTSFTLIRVIERNKIEVAEQAQIVEETEVESIPMQVLGVPNSGNNNETSREPSAATTISRSYESASTQVVDSDI